MKIKYVLVLVCLLLTNTATQSSAKPTSEEVAKWVQTQREITKKVSVESAASQDADALQDVDDQVKTQRELSKKFAEAPSHASEPEAEERSEAIPNEETTTSEQNLSFINARNKMLETGAKIESSTLIFNDKSTELQVWIKESQTENGARIIRNLRDSAYSYIVASRALLDAYNEAIAAIADVNHKQSIMQSETINTHKKINAEKDARITELQKENEQLKKELKAKSIPLKKNKKQ